MIGCWLRSDRIWLTFSPSFLPIQTLVRFELQPVSLAKPFIERCVGFFLHTDMMFRVTRRQETEWKGQAEKDVYYGDASALPGAPEE